MTIWNKRFILTGDGCLGDTAQSIVLRWPWGYKNATIRVEDGGGRRVEINHPHGVRVSKASAHRTAAISDRACHAVETIETKLHVRSLPWRHTIEWQEIVECEV